MACHTCSATCLLEALTGRASTENNANLTKGSSHTRSNEQRKQSSLLCQWRFALKRTSCVHVLTPGRNLWKNCMGTHCHCRWRRKLHHLRSFWHKRIYFRCMGRLNHRSWLIDCSYCTYRTMASTKRWRNGRSGRKSKRLCHLSRHKL
jgi:hypothetical protein